MRHTQHRNFYHDYQTRLCFEQRPVNVSDRPLSESHAHKFRTETDPDKVALNLNHLETHHRYSIAKVRQFYAQLLAGRGISAVYSEVAQEYKAKAAAAPLDTVYRKLAEKWTDFKSK